VELFPKEVSRDSGTFLREVLRIIANEGGTNVLVEGGPKVLGSLFEAGLVDQVECYIAPKILGEGGGMRPVAGQRVRKCIAESIRMSSGVWKSVGEDLHFSGVLSRQG
jgi:diaminohydroxyphosphoribosylaminopyrimidine deaminase/5-amino-6-(5-phosphoribosylamino)uracil reductase